MEANTPILDQFTEDLTVIARAQTSDPIVGREKEVRNLQETLGLAVELRLDDVDRPVLVGDCGVGKTAIVEKLAYQTAHWTREAPLRYRRVVALRAEV